MKTKMDIGRDDFDKLMNSFKNNNIEEFAQLIESGFSINCLNSKKCSLISEMMKQTDKDHARKFIDMLFDMSVSLRKIGRERSLLSIATDMHKDSYYLKKLLAKNMNINSVGVYGRRGDYGYDDPVIFNAMQHLNDDFINLLLDHKPDLGAENSRGITALNYLIEVYCKNNEYERLLPIFERFLELGADPEISSRDGSRALHVLAMFANNEKLFDILFENTKNLMLNTRNEYCNTPLILAARNGNLIGIKYLIKVGAALDAIGNYNYTAILKSIIHDENEIFNYLLDSGADLFIVDKNKDNILHHICKNEEYETSCHGKYFKEISKLHPELLDMKNTEDKTPLEILRYNEKECEL